MVVIMVEQSFCAHDRSVSFAVIKKKKGMKIQRNTENYVPIVVPVCQPDFPVVHEYILQTSVSHDSEEDDSTSSVATTRSRGARSRALGDQLQESTETANQNTNEDIDRALGSPLYDLPE